MCTLALPLILQGELVIFFYCNWVTMLAAGCGLQCDEAHSWFIILFYNERMMSFSACFFFHIFWDDYVVQPLFCQHDVSWLLILPCQRILCLSIQWIVISMHYLIWHSLGLWGSKLLFSHALSRSYNPAGPQEALLPYYSLIYTNSS